MHVRWSTRRYLTVLVAFCVIPLWVVVAALLTQSYNDKLQTAELHSQETANILSQLVDRELDVQKQVMITLASAPALQSGDLSSFYKQASMVAANFPSAQIIMADKNGQQVINTFVPFGTPLPIRNNAEAITHIFQKETPFISGVFLGAISHKPLISVDVPVSVNGKVTYDLALTTSVSSFVEILNQESVPDGVLADILDHKNFVVARNKNLEFIGQPPRQEIPAAILNAGHGKVDILTFEGKVEPLFFARSPATSWTVLVGIPIEKIKASIWRSLFLGAFGTIALALIGSGFAAMMSRIMGKSLRRLNRAAMALGRGEVVIAEKTNLQDLDGISLAMADASQLLETERQSLLQATEKIRLIAKVFETAHEGIVITDTQGTILDVNEAFLLITGYSREDVLGKNPRILRSGRQEKGFYGEMWSALVKQGAWSGEVWNRRKSGEIYPEFLSISSIVNEKGVVTHYVGIFSDITTLKRHEKQLERIAHFDALTGIPNRVLLADRMKQAIAQTRRTKSIMAVCYLDLDGFKPINDMYGHDFGDNVLVDIAMRIGMVIRGGDTVARLGGDEFVVLLLGLEKVEECSTSLQRLLSAISEPVSVHDEVFHVTASIGVSFCDSEDDDPDILLRQADQAMYAAKQEGKNRYHVYDQTHDKQAREYHEITTRIRTGLDHGEFELFYQPKIDLRNHVIIGAEALIRWNHPERGFLMPGDFLPIIQNSDLETYLGKWVIDEALAQLDQWHLQGLDLKISINIAAHHLQSKEFIFDLKSRLECYPQLPHGCLQIEILETAALNDLRKVTDVIEACKELGIGFALDDFGTGYSSLTYLRSLPADTIKIDQSFVREMLKDPADEAIVSGIIALATAFGREIVAEGVENEDLANVLRKMGCQVAQGYGIAMPMSAPSLQTWLKTPPPNFPLIELAALS